jgi:basic membrane protein A and related proteins
MFRRRVLAIPLLVVTAAAVTGLVASVAAGSRAGSGSAVKVALIGNQPFGDKGPMDQMAAGLAQCGKENGYEVKKFESLSASSYESDIRTVAQGGYQLIFTTFPPMTPATKAVATAFPNTKFGAIYQFINIPKSGAASNVWDTEFSSDATSYIYGVIGAKLSKSGKLGYITGGWDPTEDASANAYAQGAKSVNTKISVQFATANSYADPAKGKEIALAMISRGVDFIQTTAAQTQLGVIDAAKSSKIYFSGDVGDNFDSYPQGFVGYLGAGFGANIVQGCKFYKQNKLPTGQHTVLTLANGGAYIPYDILPRWGKASGHVALSHQLLALEKSLVSKIIAGKIKVVHNAALPKTVKGT